MREENRGVWELLHNLINERYHERISFLKYKQQVEDIVDDVEGLAYKIEQDLDEEAEYIASGDAKYDAKCNEAGV